MRRSRGGSSKHGHYTCKYRALQFPSAFPPSSPVYFPTANEPAIILHALGCNGLGGVRAARAIPLPLWVPAALGVSVPAPARLDLPGHPGLCAGRTGAHTCPRRVGTPGLVGLPEATRCVWDGEQSQCSPPRRPEQASSLEQSPFFRGSFPWGRAKQNPFGAGRGCRAGDVLLIYLVELLPPRRWMRWLPLALEPLWEDISAMVPLALGQSCWRG